MSIRSLCRTAALLALVGLSSGPAAAAVVSGSLSFTATSFSGAAPTDPVTGTLSYSFDNSASFFNAAHGAVQNGVPVSISVSGLNLAGSWTPVLTYVLAGMVGGNPVTDLMAVGHSLAGTVVNAGTDDWRVAFNTASTGPSFREFTYASTAAPGQLFISLEGSVNAVPEPAAALLLALGLAGLAARGSVRRRG